MDESMDKIGKIAFIGDGKMGMAIAGGLLAEGFPRDKQAAYDFSEAAAADFSADTVAAAAERSKELGKQ